VNGDGWPDLLVVGEWMPVRIFINQHGKLVEAKQTGLEKTGGLWAKILPGDFDGDGDTDYVLGNMGANLPWKASAREPLTLYADDFDGNGRLDPVLCAYVQGVSYPVASRDELLDQINPLRKKFVKYIHYADARPEDIFGAAALQKARKAGSAHPADVLPGEPGQRPIQHQTPADGSPVLGSQRAAGGRLQPRWARGRAAGG
jgi:hypothetical protein